MSSLGRFSRSARRLRASRHLPATCGATRSVGNWVNLEGYINYDDDGRVSEAEEQLKAALTKRGFDFNAYERKGFQQDQEIQENINPAALPRPDSELWGYLYGENLVDALVDLERLSAEQDYRRGYLETEITALKKKMLIHYPGLDYNAMMKHKLSQVASQVDAAGVEALADALVEDPQKIMDLSNINNFIGKHDDDDEFGYYIPRVLDSKMVNFFKFEWNRISPAADKTPYVKLLDQFKGFLNDKSGAFAKSAAPFSASLAAYTQSLLASNTADANAQLRGLLSFVGASPVVTGRANLDGDETREQLIAKIAELAGVKATASAADAARLVSLFRGADGSATEAASLKGLDAKSIGDSVTADADRVNLVIDALGFLNYIKTGDVAAAFLNGAFHHAPEFFYQFVTDPANAGSFIADNGPVVDEVLTNLGAYNKAVGEVGKAVDAFTKQLGAAAVKAGADKAEAEAVDLNAAIHAAATEGGVADGGADFFLLERLNARDNQDNVIASLTAKIGANDFLSHGKNQFWFQLFEQSFYPGGSANRRAAAAAAEDPAGFVGNLTGAVSSSLSLTAGNAAAFKEASSGFAGKTADALKAAGKTAGEAKQALNDSLSKLRLEYDDTFSSVRL